ncbi:unnamed protein product, partial [Rotaria socialis]
MLSRENDEFMEENIYEENQQFLLHSYISKEEFVKEYKRIFYDRTKAKKILYIQILTDLERSISEGNIDNLKKLSNFIHYITIVEGKTKLKAFYENKDNPLKDTNLVILACKHHKGDILKYVLTIDSNVLTNLSIKVGKTSLLPEDVDETGHNAFYYSIRSGSVELLDILIDKWPKNYFEFKKEELEIILSTAYEELKLKNVLLSEEMEIAVESKLIDLRFYYKRTNQVKTAEEELNGIKERIELVVEKIIKLNSNLYKEETFLFIASFIAQNLFVLKQLLKSTYDKLPWEEMEFCLVCFISSRIKQQEMNLFYQATLNQNKMLKHLESFAKKLEEEKVNIMGMNKYDLLVLPKNLTRTEIVLDIIDRCPEFEELYNDYQQVMDMYSLNKLGNYIELASSADSKEREGQLVITRVLQIMGEYFKNSIESPKLSGPTSEYLLLSLPKQTRKILTGLRDSLSHAKSLSTRTDIEQNADANFYPDIQKNIKKIGIIINDLLCNNKIKTIRIYLNKIVDGKSLEETEQGILEKLMEELNNSVKEKTDIEEWFVSQIHDIINFGKFKSTTIEVDYFLGLFTLYGLNLHITNYNLDINNIDIIKLMAKCALESIAPKFENQSLKEIISLLEKLHNCLSLRMQPDDLNEIENLIYKIGFEIEFRIDDIKYITKLKEKLNKKRSLNLDPSLKKAYRRPNGNYNNQLELKISELKSILSKYDISEQLIQEFPNYKINEKLQAVVEILVLDILSILGDSKDCLANNQLFIDDFTPILLGKCLRNHLAHDNAIVYLMLSDPSKAVILNAIKLTEEKCLKNRKKIGRPGRVDPLRLKERFDLSLATVVNREDMFNTLENGNLDDLKCCLKKGADLNARSVNLWTSLHYAVKGPSLEIVKFILGHNLSVKVKEINGQNPLHVASAFGRSKIVEFLIKETDIFVDYSDNIGKTPLIVAALRGHKETVFVLLKNNADAAIKDRPGYSPLHYAVQKNYKEVVEILLEKEENVDNNVALGDFTSLHIAIECGHKELIYFLLQKGADVTATANNGRTPLHAAALNGDLEAVNALISKGANINARLKDGCTPLHYAVKNGHFEVVDFLLTHGVNVNVTDKAYNNTPLHYAA